MDDIEQIERIIEFGRVHPINNAAQSAYLRAIAETQLLILKELRKNKK